MNELLSQTFTNYTHILRLSEYCRDNKIIVRRVDLLLILANFSQVNMDDIDYVDKLYKDINEYKLPIIFGYISANKIGIIDKGFYE